MLSTTGMLPPEPISTAGRPYSAASAPRAAVTKALSDGISTPGALLNTSISARAPAGSRAGRAAGGEPFEAFPEKGWDKVMDLNVKSPFFLTQALFDALKAGGSARQPAKVINITSIDGQRLNPWETYSYHASKSALIYLTKRMAARLVKDHINVTSIAPGAFASEMNKAARDHGDAIAKGIPSGRIGVDEDMAGAAIYLASRAGDYVVGDTITVDGGLVHAALGTSIDA